MVGFSSGTLLNNMVGRGVVTSQPTLIIVELVHIVSHYRTTGMNPSACHAWLPSETDGIYVEENVDVGAPVLG